jgi:uncharacterized protein (TIGR03437 family)
VNIPLGSVRVDWLHRRDFEFRFRRSLAPGGVGREKFRSIRPRSELNLAACRNGRIVVLRLQMLGSVRLHISGLLLVFSWVAAEAAALVAVPAAPTPPLPVMGLEPNNGQANSGILFLNRGNGLSTAMTAQSISYSPLGVSLNLLASNPNPSVSFSNPLPGVLNSYTGSDPAKWITGITRYGAANLAAIYPGIDAQYTTDSNGTLSLNLLLAAGVSPKIVQFQIAAATSITLSGGALVAKLGTDREFAPTLVYPAPVAVQGGGSGQVSRVVNFQVQAANTFGLVVQSFNATQPLQISIKVGGGSTLPPPFAGGLSAADASGNMFLAASVEDAAGKPAPFSTITGVGCGDLIGSPTSCSDVAICGYSASGVLNFITYLAGETNETPGFVGVAPGGSLVIAGATNSADFPVTSAAFQTSYAGPTPTPSSSGGDLFVAILDPSTGQMQASTFLGGPNADSFGTAALGADGSIYFLPVSAGEKSAGMPVTSSALQPACQGDPCQNSYAARLSPALDQLIFGTYLPGTSQATAQLYSDGSVYYAGTAQAGFPVTPAAYQQQNAGGYDGIIGRLDTSGSRLLAATYFGGPNTDWALSIALAPDGSVWADLNSFVLCCSDVQTQLIHLDANLSHLLADLPIYAGSMVVNASGDLIALAEGSIAASANSLLGGSCGGPAYIELSPSGQQLFATYLPGGYEIGFEGADAQGTPYLDTPSGLFQIAQDQPAPPSAGCVVDSPSFTNTQTISPGAIVTIFGSGMGPSQGVGYQLVNGQVPVSLGGTQVLVSGTPAPILYSSYGQVNLILPYSLQVGSAPAIQVVTNGTPLNVLSTAVVQPAGISIFQVNGSAVALNQDYTVNSPQNPAQPGSTVMLFGSGGGQTNPPSVAGQVTPLESRLLVNVPQVPVEILPPVGGPPPMSLYLNVEYAGAAPGLVSGVTQVNVTLPATIPTDTDYPPGTLPFLVEVNNQYFSAAVTISVATNYGDDTAK